MDDQEVFPDAERFEWASITRLRKVITVPVSDMPAIVCDDENLEDIPPVAVSASDAQRDRSSDGLADLETLDVRDPLSNIAASIVNSELPAFELDAVEVVELDDSKGNDKDGSLELKDSKTQESVGVDSDRADEATDNNFNKEKDQTSVHSDDDEAQENRLSETDRRLPESREERPDNLTDRDGNLFEVKSFEDDNVNSVDDVKGDRSTEVEQDVHPERPDEPGSMESFFVVPETDKSQADNVDEDPNSNPPRDNILHDASRDNNISISDVNKTPTETDELGNLEHSAEQVFGGPGDHENVSLESGETASMDSYFVIPETENKDRSVEQELEYESQRETYPVGEIYREGQEERKQSLEIPLLYLKNSDDSRNDPYNVSEKEQQERAQIGTDLERSVELPVADSTNLMSHPGVALKVGERDILHDFDNKIPNVATQIHSGEEESPLDVVKVKALPDTAAKNAETYSDLEAEKIIKNLDLNVHPEANVQMAESVSEEDEDKSIFHSDNDKDQAGAHPDEDKGNSENYPEFDKDQASADSDKDRGKTDNITRGNGDDNERPREDEAGMLADSDKERTNEDANKEETYSDFDEPGLQRSDGSKDNPDIDEANSRADKYNAGIPAFLQDASLTDPEIKDVGINAYDVGINAGSTHPDEDNAETQALVDTVLMHADKDHLGTPTDNDEDLDWIQADRDKARTHADGENEGLQADKDKLGTDTYNVEDLDWVQADKNKAGTHADTDKAGAHTNKDDDLEWIRAESDNAGTHIDKDKIGAHTDKDEDLDWVKADKDKAGTLADKYNSKTSTNTADDSHIDSQHRDADEPLSQHLSFPLETQPSDDARDNRAPLTDKEHGIGDFTGAEAAVSLNDRLRGNISSMPPLDARQLAADANNFDSIFRDLQNVDNKNHPAGENQTPQYTHGNDKPLDEEGKIDHKHKDIESDLFPLVETPIEKSDRQRSDAPPSQAGIVNPSFSDDWDLGPWTGAERDGRKHPLAANNEIRPLVPADNELRQPTSADNVWDRQPTSRGTNESNNPMFPLNNMEGAHHAPLPENTTDLPIVTPLPGDEKLTASDRDSRGPPKSPHSTPGPEHSPSSGLGAQKPQAVVIAQPVGLPATEPIDDRIGSRQSLTDRDALIPRSENRDGWSTGLFACLPNCKDVCYAASCLQCSVYDLATRMDQPDARSATVAPFCNECYLGDLRTRLRAKHGIKGAEDADCCLSCWCAPCVVGQMLREMKERNNRP